MAVLGEWNLVVWVSVVVPFAPGRALRSLARSSIRLARRFVVRDTHFGG